MVSAVAKLLDDIANREALHARDVATMPGLLEAVGLDPEDIDEDVIREAERHHRTEFFEWCRRHNVVGTRHADTHVMPVCDPIETEEDPFA